VIEKENISTTDVKYFLPPYIRSVTNDDGGVLLDLRNGRCLRLSPVGGKVWDILKQCAEGMTLDSLVDEMVRVFPGVAPDTLRRDMCGFLKDLEHKELIQPNENGSRPYVTRLKGSQKKPDELTGMPPSAWANQTAPETPAESERGGGAARERGSFAYSVLAILVLIGVDLAFKIAGFPLVHSIVSRWPVRRRGGQSTPPVERICASVDTACQCYIKHALCLQRSVVATCMLRMAGSPAEMVIAARVMPFESHAWVEVDGRVVNDVSKVKKFYQVLDRC
jgi:hypothetical protein